MSNHHNLKGLLIALTVHLFAVHPANCQTAKQIFSSSGIWQDYGMPLSVKNFPKIKGRLVNVNWSEIETGPDTWDWTIFDSDINQHVIDSLPVIVMVYTGMNAPAWIYNYGVPKVVETNTNGDTNTYSPYYLDEEYNMYFKRMITNVRRHIQNMPSSVRNRIVGIQGCYGSTGDQISYKGIVDSRYAISNAQFDSLFKVYSSYYYNEYRDVAPKISLLSNPLYTDSLQLYWLLENCPGGWVKCGTMGKGSQLNFELDKSQWLYDVLNKPVNSQYVQARSEVVGPQFSANYWIKNQYKEMFSVLNSCIYWGMDWPNETADFLQNPKFDSAFSYFNKYAGQKVAGTATNALCALKDALDASDSIRFPAIQYGAVDRYNTNRYRAIQNSFIAYGAKLEDISVVTGSEFAGLTAAGTNDVGWRLLPGNYERYLHQIDANATSAGYWNIDDAHNDVMYGRFGRGFDIAKNKTLLYFDVDDDFLRNKPLSSAYPVTIEITYFDSGTGSWRLFYDAQVLMNKMATTVTCTNSNTWKKATVTLTDAYFGNRATNKSDFYIRNIGTQNVIFSIVELSRKEQSDAGLVITSLPPFDTVCINSAPTPKSFVINGASLTGTPVQVGPLNGYAFSRSYNGPYAGMLLLSGYGNTLNETIYVKQVTATAGDFTNNILITGGGLKTYFVKASSVIVNTNPQLDAVVSLVTCNTKKDGAIDLQPQNGVRPFKYYWTSDQKSWSDTTEDLTGLQPGNYTVTVSSGPGCAVKRQFTITQPDPLVVTVTPDSLIQCKGGSTTVTVAATGGTMPYTGTGTYPASSGFTTYYVKDAKQCPAQKGYNVPNGLIAAPPKPEGIEGPSPVSKLQLNIRYSVLNADNTYIYTWTVPTGAIITSGQFTKTITVNWGTVAGNITVKAANMCDSSNALSRKITLTTGLMDGVTSEEMAVNTTGVSINPQIRLMPNPVSSTATLIFSAAGSYNCIIQVADTQGKILMKQNAVAVKGENKLQFNVSNFSPGMYFVSLLSKTGQNTTIRMVKQ